MGAGTIFVNHMAEMIGPTLLIFSILFFSAKNTWKLKTGWMIVISLFVLSTLIAGTINALFYAQLNTNSYRVIAFPAIPFFVSLVVIYFVAPKNPARTS